MFALLDEARRQRGLMMDRLGYGPVQSPFSVVATFGGARLRDYGSNKGGAGQPLLIISAPFKRPYIWDLLPEVSAVRRSLEAGRRVFLLEWTDPAPDTALGLQAYAEGLPGAATALILGRTGSPRVEFAGHSLGGTFAAIYATLHPDLVEALWLLDAPLAFGERVGGPLALAARRAPPEALGSDRPVPGSLVAWLSALAVPDEFLLTPLADLPASLIDPGGFAIHARVMRWTLDEFPLPFRLFADVVDLYREDSFMRGTLMVGERTTGISRLRGPVTAVLNTASRVVPPDSILAGLRAAQDVSARLLTYEGDRGTALEHVGPLVSPKAHRTLWPELFAP
ncbi:MAG: alpha/beta hydrolase [Proteobacteria bacterium]|nr:alpha/beta hydrolase [Pseudomonadota bacterium]